MSPIERSMPGGGPLWSWCSCKLHRVQYPGNAN